MRVVAEVLELPGFYCISSVLPQYSTIYCISHALSDSEYLAIYTIVVTGRQGAERLIAQRRVYYNRMGICEKNRGVENVTVWCVSKIVATDGRSTPR